MSDRRQIVAESWDFLSIVDQTGSGRQPGRELPDVQTEHGCVMLSSDGSGARHVLVPIGPGDAVQPDTRSRGVQLGRSSLIDAEVRRHFIDICCPEPRLFRLFDQVASSMLEALAARTDEPPALVCSNVLDAWRTMLQRASNPLGESALRGLFGELWSLVQLARLSSQAVDHWVGPDDQPQDFISARGAIEVKTTGRSPARRITISTIDQLDGTRHDFLMLVIISALEDPQGTTIPELVEQLIDLDVDETKLLDRIAKVGLQEDDFAEASKLRLRVADQLAYDVRVGFPRIIASDFSPSLAPGVSSLRYEVEVAAAHPFRLSPEERQRRERILLGVSSP
jgi:hypothetical protein